MAGQRRRLGSGCALTLQGPVQKDPGGREGATCLVAGQHEGRPDLLAFRSHALCRFPLPDCVSAVASFRGTFQDRTRRGTVSAVIPFMQCFLSVGNKKVVYCFASLMPRNSFKVDIPVCSADVKKCMLIAVFS